jgi:hypothetical protein
MEQWVKVERNFNGSVAGYIFEMRNIQGPIDWISQVNVQVSLFGECSICGLSRVSVEIRMEAMVRVARICATCLFCPPHSGHSTEAGNTTAIMEPPPADPTDPGPFEEPPPKGGAYAGG